MSIVSSVCAGGGMRRVQGRGEWEDGMHLPGGRHLTGTGAGKLGGQVFLSFLIERVRCVFVSRVFSPVARTLDASDCRVPSPRPPATLVRARRRSPPPPPGAGLVHPPSHSPEGRYTRTPRRKADAPLPPLTAGLIYPSTPLAAWLTPTPPPFSPLAQGWTPEISYVLDSTPASAVEQRDLYDRWPELFRSWAQGSTVLIGDAIHPMMPNLGQVGVLGHPGGDLPPSTHLPS
jgi:hypothetical protein